MNIAIAGVCSPVGEAILSLLQERQFPSEAIVALDTDDEVGKRVNYGDKYLSVKLQSSFDFSDTRLVIAATDAASITALAPRISAAGARLLDCSGAFCSDPAVPLLVAGVNDHLLHEWLDCEILAVPSAATTQLVKVLEPLHREAVLHRLNVTTCHPVSGAGLAGVEALSLQSARLLNAQPVEHSVFPQQIAFNLIPQVGGLQQGGHSTAELNLIAEVRKVLADPMLMIQNTAITVPVFYGTSQSVCVYFHEPLGVDRAADIIAETDGVTFASEEQGDASPTPVTDSAGSESVFVGRLREDFDDPSILQFWIVADNVRSGVALNCVEIAESIAKNFE